MKLAIASDHAGVNLKQLLMDHLAGRGGFDVHDFGVFDASPSDYPDYARKVAESLLSGASERGILVCGSGVGMSVAANKYPGIRAAVIDGVDTARQARAHVDTNVAVFGERQITADKALPALDAWLDTAFEGGRHKRRVDKISEIEREVRGHDGKNNS
ncbi:MAG: ribose 5-phosphate isomerase B [Deltaproteobacteria bacterium]|nr:ribose 5-phosphate isomerase B [Deltaproteobacteria bacterium]